MGFHDSVYALYRTSGRLLTVLLVFLITSSLGNVLLASYTVKGVALDTYCIPIRIPMMFYSARYSHNFSHRSNRITTE